MEYPLKGIYDHKGRFHQSTGISAILMIDTGGLQPYHKARQNAWHQALVRLLQICKTRTKPGSIKHCKSGKFPQELYYYPV